MGMVCALVIRLCPEESAHRDGEVLWNCGVYTRGCVLGLHLEMEQVRGDVYGEQETEQGPLPLLSPLAFISNTHVPAFIILIYMTWGNEG